MCVRGRQRHGVVMSAQYRFQPAADRSQRQLGGPAAGAPATARAGARHDAWPSGPGALRLDCRLHFFQAWSCAWHRRQSRPFSPRHSSSSP
eukprot:COSAG06_NODE_2123_length_7541_cov_11.635313_4_plen_91_part_00